MKDKIEINQKIREMQRQMNLRFQHKREAENESESANMMQIDQDIDKLGAQIIILQWVLN